MAQEIEMKLGISSEQIDNIKTHHLLQQSQLIKNNQWILSRYYDTPDLQLKALGFALRTRQKDNQFWLTVKDEGSSQDGLHQRNEWEYPIQDDQIDLTQLPEAIYTKIQPLHEQLQRLFTTEFKRTTWNVHWHNTTIEAAFDLGNIYIDQHWREPIRELELEIIQGDSEGLLDFSKQLNRDLALKPFNQSKAYRGYRLFYMANQHA